MEGRSTDRISPVTHGEVEGEVHKGSQIFTLDVWEEAGHLPVEETEEEERFSHLVFFEFDMPVEHPDRVLPWSLNGQV